ncbi:hypothetical protein [Allonocardiopsis opalescens]|uniref:Uncharacterized protein n=1 Tax=Allonocardiopsis opalescens TaxID=1144618 RepID=A0A2T0PSW2_9ACTN|nr:hypothetical protein [Allonocardiopsis opalescens]PRX92001.1 hypothetical protein CLV72_11274 [Allonocardiopsis opalescens]
MSSYYTIDWEAIGALEAPERLRVLAEVAAEVSHAVGAERARIVGAEVERQLGIRKAAAQRRAAQELGLKESRLSQIWRDYQQMKKDIEVTRVAYDFGEELHIMDVDGFGVHDPASVEVIALDGRGRDAALKAAGYAAAGGWVRQGEAEGVTVLRAADHA